jgi:hypothetical protein
MDLKRTGWEYIDCMQFTQDREQQQQQQVAVNTVIKLRVYKMQDISCLTEQVLACQEEIRSAELVTCHFYVSDSVSHFMSVLF